MKIIFKLITMTAIISMSLILVEGIIYVPTQVVLNLNPFMPSLLMNAIIGLRALLMFGASYKVPKWIYDKFQKFDQIRAFLFLSDKRLTSDG